MHVTGIITEYNPFHTGHHYQLTKIRQAHPDSAVIAVMSGSIVQRGQPALLDKWSRALLAVQGGCDLVLELPFVFACRSAQDFAHGAVALLSRLNVVNSLAFGAESTDLTVMQNIAVAIDKPALQAALHEHITAGESYAAALTTLLADCPSCSANMLHQPNNILAIEYLRALRQYAPNLQPLLIPRTGAGYHDTDIAVSHASASAIRALLGKTADVARRNGDDRTLTSQLSSHDCLALKESLPAASWQAICRLSVESLPTPERLLLPLQTLFLRSSLPRLTSIYGINEGLENRLASFITKASSYQRIIQDVSSKRYPASRIARTLIWLLLRVHWDFIARMDEAGPLYARVLAAGPRGRNLLHDIKRAGTIPLISKTSSFLTTIQRSQGIDTLSLLQQQLAFDTLATELRQLTLPATAVERNDFQQSPLFLAFP